MDQQLIATAAAVLGTLFAGTVRKVGSDLESAATTVAADEVAKLVRRWLGPEHRLSKALEKARGGSRDQPPPAGLEATLRKLAETKPEFLVELRGLLGPPQPPHQSTITVGSVDQHGDVNIVGPATINAGSIGGPSADSPDLVVHPPPDPADGPASLVLQGTIVVAGPAEINIIRGPSEPARQLEAVRGFVGRETELRWLREQLQPRPGGAPMVMIVGEPGVGKTDLALMVANQLADEDYPDLQLQVGLSPPPRDRAAPPDVGEVLRGILLALDKAPEEIPDSEVERAKEYRSQLKTKRALVLLDGATDAHQVRLLEPPQGCAFIVTTRIALSGALERKAEPLWLGRLSRREAVALLAARVGSARVARQPLGAAQLVDACDRLPQALVVTAAFLAGKDGRHARLRRVAADLRRRPLRPGTRLFALTAAFDLSYRQLPDQQRETFQLLGLLNSVEVNLGAFARAADIAVDEAERRLGALAIVSLVEGRPGRWRLRPLVLDYARERADQELPGPARSDALQRALQYQLMQVRNQRRSAEVAKRDPAAAARRQAELARGAALVDAAVSRELDLLELAGKNLAGVLHEVITAWPDPDRRGKAVRSIQRVAARPPNVAAKDGSEAAARQQRALRWLAEHPKEPPPRPVGHVVGVPAPTTPERAERWPLHQGTMSVSGNGFWPNETILVRVDGDYEWTTLADASGAYDTSRPYGPSRARPRRAYMTGLTSGIQAEARFTSDESG